MPEVLKEWVDGKNLKSCLKLQQDLLATYRDDFHKYGGEIDAGLLNRLLLSVAEQLGNKAVLSYFNSAISIGSELRIAPESRNEGFCCDCKKPSVLSFLSLTVWLTKGCRGAAFTDRNE